MLDSQGSDELILRLGRQMTSPSLLDDIRGSYLDHFRRVVKEKRRVPAARVFTESTLRMKNGLAARKGPLKLPFRKDLVVRSPTVRGSFEIKTEEALQFEPLTFTWGQGLPVTVAPFRWEECPVQIQGFRVGDEPVPLVDWYERWFDEFDTKGPFKKDFQEVVHFLEITERKDEIAKLTIDLGSAPKAAIEELLDALEQVGCTRIDIGEGDQIGN